MKTLITGIHAPSGRQYVEYPCLITLTDKLTGVTDTVPYTHIHFPEKGDDGLYWTPEYSFLRLWGPDGNNGCDCNRCGLMGVESPRLESNIADCYMMPDRTKRFFVDKVVFNGVPLDGDYNSDDGMAVSLDVK